MKVPTISVRLQNGTNKITSSIIAGRKVMRLVSPCGRNVRKFPVDSQGIEDLNRIIAESGKQLIREALDSFPILRTRADSEFYSTEAPVQVGELIAPVGKRNAHGDMSKLPPKPSHEVVEVNAEGVWLKLLPGCAESFKPWGPVQAREPNRRCMTSQRAFWVIWRRWLANPQTSN